MKRIPNSYKTQDSYSVSLPLTTSSWTTSGSNPSASSGSSTLTNRSLHNVVGSFESLSIPGPLGTLANTAIGPLSMVDYVMRRSIRAALYMHLSGSSDVAGSMSIVAYLDDVEVARSLPKSFTADHNGFLVHTWTHGLPLGLGDLYTFKLEFDILEAFEETLCFSNIIPFFSFFGSGSSGTTGGGGTVSPTDLRNMYLDRYSHGPTEVIVDGTSIQDAIDSMSPTGGIILIKQSATPYAAFNFNDKQFTSYCSVMAFPGHVPQVTGIGGDVFGNETAVIIDGAQKVGVYGLDISSYNQSGHPYADAVVVSDSTEVAIWANIMHDAVHGIGVNGAVGAGANHVDACYNKIYNCAGWLDTMASGISFYQLQNVGGGDDSDGYSCRIVGNIIWDCENDPSWGAAVTDGNGIIIDIANGAYSTSAINYLGTVLVANNICVGNGGRGVHALFSRNVHEYFNTCASNLKSATMIYDGEITQIGSAEGGRTAYNIAQSDRDIWFGSNESTMDMFDYNVVVRGTIPTIDGTNIDKTTTPDYFVSPSITAATAAGWTPRTPDRIAVDAAIRAVLEPWPDAAGNLRPTTGPWTIGAVETASSPGGGGGGVVPGSGTPTTPVAPIFHPEDFGAVGDGIADDTAALQDCLDALGGGTMLLTPGSVYNHSAVLHVTSGNINGGGYRSGNTVINAGRIHATVDDTSAVWFDEDNTSAYGVIFSSSATTRGVTWDHMKVVLWGDGHVMHEVMVDGSHAAGIFMQGASNYVLRSCVVKNTMADSIHNTGSAFNGLITDPYIENSGDDGVAVVSYNSELCHDITVLRPVYRGGLARGLSVVGGENIIFRDIDIQGSQYAGVYLSSEIEYNTNFTNNVLVSGGTLRGCAYGSGHPSILFYNSNFSVDNCRAENLHIYDQAGSGGAYIAAYFAPMIGNSVSSILVHDTGRTLVYDPDNVLTVTGVAFA